MASRLHFILIVIILRVHLFMHGRGQASVAASIYTNSEAEEFALTEFRELVDDLAYRKFMRSDGYLIRWLIQTDFDVQEAFKNFRKSMEWRRLKKVDFVVFEDFSLIDPDITYVMDSFDKDGRPVLWMPVGTYDVRKLTIAGLQDLYQRYGILIFELNELFLSQQCSQHPNITQEVLIVDLAGFNVKTVGCLKCVQMVPEWISNFDQNYPRIVFKSFLINAPKIFHHALNIAKHFLSAKSREEMRLFGHDKNEWIPVLHEQISPDQLPVEYGGTKPSFRGKAARDNQQRKLEALLVEARKAVRKDMLAQPSCEEGSVLRKGSVDQETPQRHEPHHHYAGPPPATPTLGLDGRDVQLPFRNQAVQNLQNRSLEQTPSSFGLRCVIWTWTLAFPCINRFYVLIVVA